MTGRFSTALALWALLAASAHANSLQTPTQDSELEKCGEAKLSVLLWDVYESALFTPDGTYREGVRPLRLEIRYLRDIKSRDLVKQTRKEWRGQGLEAPHHEAWLQDLLAIWPDVSKGDLITLNIAADGSSTFLFNGEAVGGFSDPRFGEDFAAIWLSPNTSRPELRSALIGGTGALGS